jgi:hypothetical protein
MHPITLSLKNVLVQAEIVLSGHAVRNLRKCSCFISDRTCSECRGDQLDTELPNLALPKPTECRNTKFVGFGCGSLKLRDS